MQMLGKIIAYIAPHYCIGCGTEDQLLCSECAQNVFRHDLGYCVFCGIVQYSAQVCGACQVRTKITAVWSVGVYEGMLQELIHALKFEGARSAAGILARELDNRLPPLPANTVVVPLPTSPQRVRQRGYDQAVLLARDFAKRRNLSCVPLLHRVHNIRQVGATRPQRLAQAAAAYKLTKLPPAESPILLIDDVLTTGSSMMSATSLLTAAGVKNVQGAIAAYRP